MGKQGLAAGILVSIMMAWCVSAVQAEEKRAKDSGDWYSFLKGIPIGPGKLDVGGSLRLRYEYFNGFNIRMLNARDDDLLLERFRISFDYRLSNGFHFFVEGQDSHYWLNRLRRGTWPASCAYENTMDLRQAHAEWQHIGGTPWGFKIGRQSISYRDKRIFGPGNWGNVGRYWWDAGKISYDTDVVGINALIGWRVRTDWHNFDDEHHDYEMYAAYARIKKLPAKVDLFYVLRYDDHNRTVGESGTDDRKTHTIGVYVDGKIGKNTWDYGGTFAVQRGEWGKDDIEAYGANARLGYTFDAPWSPRIGAEFSWASGDDDPTDGTHETFDGVFGAVDCFYGRMNLLAWMNLQDYQLTFSVNPTKKLKIWLDYHYFRLDSDKDAWYYCSGRPQRVDATGNSGSTLGHEVDLLAKWQATKNFEVFAGYAHFFPGSFIRNTAGGSRSADWFFLQCMYSF